MKCRHCQCRKVDLFRKCESPNSWECGACHTHTHTRRRLPAYVALPSKAPPPLFCLKGKQKKNPCSQFVLPLQLSACAADQPTFKAMIHPTPRDPPHTQPSPRGRNEGVEVVLGGQRTSQVINSATEKKFAEGEGRGHAVAKWGCCCVECGWVGVGGLGHGWRLRRAGPSPSLALVQEQSHKSSVLMALVYYL